MANFNPVCSSHKMHVHSIQFDFMPVWNLICQDHLTMFHLFPLFMLYSLFRVIQIFFLLGNHHHWELSSTRGCLFCAYENSNVKYEQLIWIYLYIHVNVAYWNKDWCTLLNWHKYILINVNIYLVHNKIKYHDINVMVFIVRCKLIMYRISEVIADNFHVFGY